MACIWPVTGFGAEGIRLAPALSIYADENTSPMKEPEGVACRAGQIVVADTANGRLLRYSLAEETLSGGQVISTPQLQYPVRVSFGAQGDIFVLDGKTRKILRLKASGEVLGPVEPKGLPSGTAVMTKSFALDSSDRLYLLDPFGHRVLLLAPDGSYQGEIPLPGEGGFFSSIAIGPKGSVYLLDSVNATVFAATREAGEFSPLSGSLEEYLNFPTYITVDRRGLLYVVDQNGSGLVMLDKNGNFKGRQLTMGWKPGLVYYPAQICLTDNDELVVADRSNSRVQLYKINR